MAEGIGLLNQRTILLYHGFESLFLRANKKIRIIFVSFSCSFYPFILGLFQAKKKGLKKRLVSRIVYLKRKNPVS